MQNKESKLSKNVADVKIASMTYRTPEGLDMRAQCSVLSGYIERYQYRRTPTKRAGRSNVVEVLSNG